MMRRALLPLMGVSIASCWCVSRPAAAAASDRGAPTRRRSRCTGPGSASVSGGATSRPPGPRARMSCSAPPSRCRSSPRPPCGCRPNASGAPRGRRRGQPASAVRPTWSCAGRLEPPFGCTRQLVVALGAGLYTFAAETGPLTDPTRVGYQVAVGGDCVGGRLAIGGALGFRFVDAPDHPAFSQPSVIAPSAGLTIRIRL